MQSNAVNNVDASALRQSRAACGSLRASPGKFRGNRVAARALVNRLRRAVHVDWRTRRRRFGGVVPVVVARVFVAARHLTIVCVQISVDVTQKFFAFCSAIVYNESENFLEEE